MCCSTDRQENYLYEKEDNFTRNHKKYGYQKLGRADRCFSFGGGSNLRWRLPFLPGDKGGRLSPWKGERGSVFEGI
jgi:hypothetical protein